MEDFAFDPSQPTWVAPHRLELDDSQPEATQKHTSQVHRRTERLTRAQHELGELCSATGFRSKLEDFLTTWRDPKQPDRVQPNALAWFQAAEPLTAAIRNSREDAIPILLAHGVRLERPDVWAALDVLESTGNRTVLELLLQGGWEKDQALNENATSILG